MFFTRRFKRLFALLALLIWIHLDISTAYAIAYQSAAQFPSVKITPVIDLSSSVEDQELRKLFDRNTDTAYTPAAPALVEIKFDSLQLLSELRIYGPASYLLSVQGQINGQWQNVEPLQDTDLRGLDSQWQSYPLTTPLETDTLRLQFIPTAQAENEQGIREIEFWSPGQHEPIRSGVELRSLLDQGIAVKQNRQYLAEPASGVIGPDAGEYVDAASDNTFRFDLAYRPEQIKRTYFSYELAGLAHWTSAIRTINEQTAMGGYVIERGQGGRQVEEIAPAWLRQGTNQIRFVPVDADSTYTVSNVQVLIELDDGANFVRKVNSNMGKDRAEAASLYDGDTGTGLAPVQQQDSMITGWERQLWQPVAEAAEVDSAAVELAFDRLTDLSAVGFYATGKLKGQVRVLLRKQSDWLESASSRELNSNKAGWQYLHLSDGQDAQAVRLVFEDASGKGAVSEVRAIGSNLGAGDEPVINITYPDAGQYFGDKVYVRGFASPDNGSGQARLYVGRQEISSVNGEFETVADAADADAEGFLEVTAVYPDGKNAVSRIPLQKDRLEENSEIEVREYRNLIDEADDKETEEDGESAAAGNSGIYSDVNLIEDFLLTGGKAEKLHSSKTGAEIEADKGAVRQSTRIRMMTLRDRDLPALDAQGC